MTRRMSCSMTVDQVRDRTKTVTRRHINTWRTLKPGDRLTLIEKGMGLTKGEKQQVLAEVEVVKVTIEPLATIVLAGELAREGLGHMTGPEFVAMWADSHGYRAVTDGLERLALPTRRIEWRYLDLPGSPCRVEGGAAPDPYTSGERTPPTDELWAPGEFEAELNRADLDTIFNDKGSPAP